ncbi:hypothetical protein KKA27_01045 [Patescibacteria group bacterium]|nr:hypothetical protein [Patescibacteria group bacterium]MBU2632974.1 hypothetical protein [Patescibacteria group bacterium]
MFQIASLEKISEVLSNPTWDILVLFFFLATGFFYGVLAGKKKLLSVLFSLYIAILLLNNFFYLDILAQGKELRDAFLLKLSAFLIFIILLAILFNKTVFRGSSKNKKWWQVFVLSFLEIGLFVSAIFQFLPAKEVFSFSPIVEMLFASEKSFFWWMVLPLVSLLFILRKKEIRP